MYIYIYNGVYVCIYIYNGVCIYIYIWYIYTFIYQWLYPMYIQCINIDRERWAMKICKAYEGIFCAPIVLDEIWY